MASDLITVSQGISSAWTVTIRKEDGTPFTTYTGTELLAGSVRTGRDQPALFLLTPVWLSASAGTITLPIPGASTTAVAVGRYLVDVKLADNSADLYDGFLEVTYSPGIAAAPTSYGTFADMLSRAPWIEKLQRPTDLAGFGNQRQLARKWFDDLLHRHYRLGSGISTDFAFVPGISFGGRFGEGLLWRDGRRSADLQTWLDANRLDVTEQVIDACANYAIALLCDRQVTPGKDDNGYATAARKYFARAGGMAANITAEIDTNGDGRNDIVIRLGITDTLEG